MPDSGLDHLIAPEIKDDEFYRCLEFVAGKAPIQSILEIGSSSGDGSTAALVSGLMGNPHRPTLFCLEVSQSRFDALARRYAGNPRVNCCNASSVSLGDFPDEDAVAAFHAGSPAWRRRYPLDTVLGWRRQDIDYIRRNRVAENGIARVRREHGIDRFGFVLIDGSEFTGMAELAQVHGAGFIALDDINTFKNGPSFARLMADPAYDLLVANKILRNGFALFKHRG